MKKFKNFKLVLPFLILISLYSPKVYAAEECFENVSRAVFKFNMALDDIILEPLAKGYNKLPSPLRTGTAISLQILGLCCQYQTTFCRKF